MNTQEKLKALTKMVLENRSLAESDPINLLKFPEFKELYEDMGPTKYIAAIYYILDLYE